MLDKLTDWWRKCDAPVEEKDPLRQSLENMLETAKSGQNYQLYYKEKDSAITYFIGDYGYYVVMEKTYPINGKAFYMQSHSYHSDVEKFTADDFLRFFDHCDSSLRTAVESGAVAQGIDTFEMGPYEVRGNPPERSVALKKFTIQEKEVIFNRQLEQLRIRENNMARRKDKLESKLYELELIKQYGDQDTLLTWNRDDDF